jgi:hypothetical protein
VRLVEGRRLLMADIVAKVWRLGGSNFFRAIQAPLKKHMGVHSNDRSRHQGPPSRATMLLNSAFSSRRLLRRFSTPPNFSTFATVSAKSSLAYGDDPACRLRWITH